MFLLVALMGNGGNHLLDYASSELYWKSKGVAVGIESMLAELKPADKVDAAELIRQLASPDPEVRQQAAKGILQKGKETIPQLQEATRAADPQLAAAAKNLIAELSLSGKAAEVRRLMAIRTLGEIKRAEAMPTLKSLADSKDVFVAEYARRAIASIEGKAYEIALPAVELRRTDAMLLPAECRAVLQQSAAGAQTMSFDRLVNDLDVPAEMQLNKAEIIEKITSQVISIAEQTGDVRIDTITVGVSGDIGGNAGFVVAVVRGQYDARAAAATLQRLGVPLKNVGGADVFSPDNHAALIPASNDRFILLAGPKLEAMPLEAMATAITANKGGLAAEKEMTKLIDTVDTTQALWGVMKVTDTYRQAPPLAPFDWLTLVGRQKDQTLGIQIDAKGADGNKIADAVAEVNQTVQQALAELKPMAEQMKMLKPVADFLESIRCTSEGGKASLTASLKASPSLLMSVPMMIGLRAVPAQADVPPAPVQPVPPQQ